MPEVHQLQDRGRFDEADQLVRQALDAGSALTTNQRRALEFELERSRRIRKDYSVSEARLKELLAQRIKDFQPAEFDQWVEQGRFDFLEINGERRFFGSSIANLFKRYDDLGARNMRPSGDRWVQFLYQHARDVTDATAAHPGLAMADPHDFRLTMTITVDKDAVPADETIRCWMPFPQQFEAQGNVRLVSSSPAVQWMNAPAYPMRSLYFEQPSKGAEPTPFTATYDVSIWPRRVQVDPGLVTQEAVEKSEHHEYFTAEQPPHVVFSPRIRALVAEIVGEETNPAKKARLIYDWFGSGELRYSFAREYSTLRCIPEYVLDNKYGDCGQHALLFITLCRAAGVPARWSSGWVIYPQFQNLHDWTEIYLPPYGWIPVDPDYNVELATGYLTLTDDQRAFLKDFFFGGLDAYRLTVNRQHGFPHHPPKKDFRSDDVDFQRGELETAGGRNIYFSDFNYNMDVNFLTESDRAAAGGGEKQAGAPTPTLLVPGIVR